MKHEASTQASMIFRALSLAAIAFGCSSQPGQSQHSSAGASADSATAAGVSSTTLGGSTAGAGGTPDGGASAATSAQATLGGAGSQTGGTSPGDSNSSGGVATTGGMGATGGADGGTSPGDSNSSGGAATTGGMGATGGADGGAVSVSGGMTNTGGAPASGGATGTGNSTIPKVSGVVQKGPFILGTAITLQELDANLNQTGRSFTFQTDDNVGHFHIPTNVTARFVEITAMGYYFDELSNQLSHSQLTLRTLSDLTSSESVNVNLLTSLAASRERVLVSGGQSFQAARAQAEREVLTSLNLTGSGGEAFDQMDISQSGDNNALLLAASVLLAKLAYVRGATSPVAQLFQLLSTLSADIAVDGTYDDATTASLLRCIIPAMVDMASVRSNLENRYGSLGSSATVPQFEQYLRVPDSCCVADTKRCSGMIRQSCDEVGRWIDSVCPDATPVCKDGRCEPLCTTGDERCGGTTRQHCDSSGHWQDQGQCTWGQPVLLQSISQFDEPPQIAVDHAGNVTTTWLQYASDEDGNWGGAVWAARYVIGAGWGSSEPVSDTNWRQNQAQIGVSRLAVADSGEVTIGWSQNHSADEPQTAYARSYIPGSGWETTPHVLYTASDLITLLMSYSGNTSVALWVSPKLIQTSERQLTGSWSIPQSIAIGSDGVAAPVSIAKSSSGAIAVSWLQVDGALYFTDVRTYKPATGWSAQHTLGSGVVANASQLAVNSANDVLVIGQESDGITYTNWYARHTDASGWGDVGTLDEKVNLTTLGVESDADGNAVAFQVGCTGVCVVDQVYGRRYDAHYGWRKPVLVSSNKLLLAGGQMAMDSLGNAIIIWEQFDELNSTREIWSNRYRSGLGWGMPERLRLGSISGSNLSGRYLRPALTIDAKGRVTVVWQEATTNGGIGLFAMRFE